MSNSPSSLQHGNNYSGGIQALILFGIIALLIFFLVPKSPDSSQPETTAEVRHTPQPTDLSTPMPTEITSPPEIDLSAMPIAMYTMQNPNAWETPKIVSLTGTFQEALGCTDNWMTDCEASKLTYEALNDIWQASFQLPAGNYEYKAILDSNLSHSYGLYGLSGENSPAITLELSSDQIVNFYYDHKTGWITDDVNALIVSVAGNFQEKVGCSEEWQAECLRAWMQDVDGDGIYTYETVHIPAGSWEAKIALNGSLDENYGADGKLNGDAIQLFVPGDGHLSVMAWSEMDKTLTIFVSSVPIVASENLPPLAPKQ